MRVERANEAGEAERAVAPCVDVLPEQGDLARAAVDQRMRLGDDVGGRSADLGAAGVGHDAISAEFVAAFLDGEEGRRSAAAARGHSLELRNRRHVGVERPAAARRLGDQFGQAMIGLRTDDDVDQRRAPLRLGAFGLGDAAGQGDHRLRAILAAQPADVRIGPLRRFLADVAGVEHDEIGVLALACRGHAAARQQLAHALAVIDVHLAAEAFDSVRGGGHSANSIGGVASDLKPSADAIAACAWAASSLRSPVRSSAGEQVDGNRKAAAPSKQAQRVGHGLALRTSRLPRRPLHSAVQLAGWRHPWRRNWRLREGSSETAADGVPGPVVPSGNSATGLSPSSARAMVSAWSLAPRTWLRLT